MVLYKKQNLRDLYSKATPPFDMRKPLGTYTCIYMYITSCDISAVKLKY